MGWEVDLDWVGAVLITERRGEGERKVVRLIVYLLLFNLLPAHTCFNLGEVYYQHSYCTPIPCPGFKAQNDVLC